ncbi:sensor histidine kinase [Magnetovibrio blakemorei]|uniref:histidine kinase n=1 Tax=Magnetovibrio blakemorei TaxID=28181 RepID=A0A1E5QBU9_9PROT|nr:HAMP domain-containing sensor histidine kinase [Magnetovibrio blakemorei]OEJ69539.1 hypothetical protein BEN30_02720 [Magnetovibrio blakemorei]
MNKKSENTTEDEFKNRLRDFAHEIGSPLNAMIGYSHLIRTEFDGGGDLSKIREYSDTIETSTKRLLKICERVLDDAVTGEQSVRLEVVHMSKLADGVVSTFKEQAKSRGIILKSSFQNGFPKLLTDPILVEQVLSNLVSNAIKFTPTGGSIDIHGEIGQGGRTLIFVIRDTGKGIPANFLMKIRNGERVTSSAKETGQKGWGRGLAIATEICKRLKADLVFAPAKTGGAIVMFSLPINTDL